MIAYLDTSALVKLIVDESGSDQVEAVFMGAAICFTHPVAWVEAHSAIERKRRESRGFSAAEAEAARQALRELWRQIARTPIDEGLLERAVSMVRSHGLRTYDALHMAAALWVRETSRAENLLFACHDSRLRDAATMEGLRLAPEQVTSG